jgi:hypothetical protein
VEELKTNQILITPIVDNINMGDFKNYVNALSECLPENTKAIVINVKLKIGETDGRPTSNNRFNYINKNNITVLLHPEVKYYVPFKSKENAEKYVKEEMDENDLVMILDVVDGKVVIE